jgi:hypothetical protein
LKRALFLSSFVICICLVLISAGCGGNNSGSTSATTPVGTTLKKRAFLLNQFFAAIDIIDAEKDLFSGKTITVDAQPQIMLVLSNKQTLIYQASGNGIALIDNTLETNAGSIVGLPGATESIVVTPDNLFAYAAIPSTGKIAVVDLTAKTVTSIPADTAAPATIPGVRRLVMTKNGNTILAFSDNADTVTFVDRTNSNAVSQPVGGFDRPYTAVISSDDTKAYVLNCGRECGGTSAGIVPVTLTTKALSNAIAVGGATVAVADSTNLYVAGTDVVKKVGTLDVVNLSTLVDTPVTTPISDGLHTTMALAANNKLYIGSRACTNSGGQCLSVFEIGKPSATIISGAIGDVQAITPIKNRTVVYVIQNGLLKVYDTATDTPQTTPTILVTGKVVDVKEVD